MLTRISPTYETAVIALGSNAIGEESVSHNLSRLSPRDIVLRSEVGSVLRFHARFSRSSTWVPSHHVTGGQPLDILVEGVGGLYVFERFAHRWFYEPGGIRDDLGCLSTSSISEGVEVGSAGRYAWIGSRSWVAWIP